DGLEAIAQLQQHVGAAGDRTARLGGERGTDLQRDVEKNACPEKEESAGKARQEDSFHGWSPPRVDEHKTALSGSWFSACGLAFERHPANAKPQAAKS